MKVFAVALTIFLALSNLQAQNGSDAAGDPAIAPPQPTPKLSESLAKKLQDENGVSRERREQAYAKLLEGQRYIWSMQRLRSQMGLANGARLAKEALQKAVELDPTLAEAYTALAELTLIAPPRDADEAIKLAGIAVRLNPNNFGAHRILARLYTLKSRLGSGELHPEFSEKAIAAWKEMIRLDPRYAEGWAFLSAFYEKQGKTDERIDALNRWIGSSTPIETTFYRTVMGNQEALTNDSANVKLGSALIEAGRSKEAIEILSRSVADDPQNQEAVELLREAVGSADPAVSALAIEALQQAIYSNPENLSLIQLSAQIQTNSGRIDQAAKTIRDAVSKLQPDNKNAAAALQIQLGDIYAEADRADEAIAIYQNALRMRGIGKNELVSDADRDFAANVFGKIIQIYKNTNRINEAKTLIENSRPNFGRDDLFADRQLIELHRETGNSQAALQTVRAARVRFPGDYSLLRTEASILTELGKVDEGVNLIKSLIGRSSAVPSIMNDDFVNYLYISGLYSQAKRGKEAIEAANQAFAATTDNERKQIAKLTLATAQHMSGDFQSAEKTLREILRQSPNNPIALNNLGYFLIERDEKIQEAYDLIRQAVKIDPTNPSYLDSLGWANFKLGKLNEAEKYLKQASRYDSASATIQEHLGDVYFKQGKIKLAKAAWQKAATLTTDADKIRRLKAKIAK